MEALVGSKQLQVAGTFVKHEAFKPGACCHVNRAAHRHCHTAARPHGTKIADEIRKLSRLNLAGGHSSAWSSFAN
jgi:hypothetical protein